MSNFKVLTKGTVDKYELKNWPTDISKLELFLEFQPLFTFVKMCRSIETILFVHRYLISKLSVP